MFGDLKSVLRFISPSYLGVRLVIYDIQGVFLNVAIPISFLMGDYAEKMEF